MVVNLDDVVPAAADLTNRFENLVIGTSGRGDVRFKDDNLFGLCFPHLFPDGTGFWKFSMRKEVSLKIHTKMLLSHPFDRRFARSCSFIFFVADHLEKLAIHSYRRTTISGSQRRNLNQHNIMDVDPTTGYSRVREDITSNIPHIIRSSYSYKRKRFLDLMAMFREFGEPQVFLTMTCNDFSEDFLNVVGDEEPWADPVRFANHFRHYFHRIFTKAIKRTFGTMVGGIKEFFWVMELQARGSPHIHMLLWTGHSLDTLMTLENVVVADLPPANHPLRNLVAKHQVHRCSVYCMPNGISRCRFGFPFGSKNETSFEDGRMLYKRNIESGFVNPYNPFLLTLMRCNMDIQLNKGHRAMSYLCKYLTKFDTGASFNVVDGEAPVVEDSNPYVSHFRGRHYGIIEAVYDIFGWHKGQASKDVIMINTNMPGNERYTLKGRGHMNPNDPDDIVYDSQLGKARNYKCNVHSQR